MTRHMSVLTAGVVAVGAQSFVLAPLLPDIAAGLGTGTAEAGRALAAYGAGIVASALLLGPRLDRFPRRTTLAAGMAAIALAALGSALAPAWPALAAAQLLGGAGVGVVLPATYALAAELAPPGAAARATGRVLTGWSIALVAGVPLAAVLGDAVGWRGAFAVLAAAAAVQVLLYRGLPQVPVAATRPAGLRAALRTPGVAPLLAGVAASMTAFYGVFAFAGTEVREVHGGGAVTAGLLALAYGLGFGLGAAADRHLDRLGGARLVAPALGALAAVYLVLGAVTPNLSVLLGVAAVWGVANHVVVTLLVSRLSVVADGSRGAVLALNSAATYGGAAVAGLAAGPLHAGAGFGWVTAAAAVVVAAAVPVVLRHRTRDLIVASAA